MEIDLDKVIKTKMGTRAKWVPSFVVNYLKRFIHQEWVNTFIRQEEERGVVGVQWLRDCLEFCNISIVVHGEENLPLAESHPCTFVSNHPLGGPDGIALGAVIGPHYEGKVKYLVNDFLMFFDALAPLFIPINKTGRQSRSFPAMVEAGFSSPNHMLMFPAGLCSRLIDGKVQDIPWKKTFITKSVETQRDVVPMHFAGENSSRFYKIAQWNKRLGIKFNFAMAFLPDELYRAQGKTFHVYIGKPISWQTFTDKSKTPLEWADYVRSSVYQLGK